jgi:hypothetical protein
VQGARAPGILLLLEFCALFIALPVILLHILLAGVKTFPILWLYIPAAIAAFWLVLKRGWTLKKMFGFQGVAKKDWLHLALRVAVGAAALAALLWFIKPDALLQFPRRSPSFWLVVMFTYPLLSVIPQGILYRALFFERYAPLFGRFAVPVAMLAFCHAHIVFGNIYALALTLAGGAVFTWQYRKTKSLAFANLEHALMGDLVFTIGWGMFLHGGTINLLRGVA